MVALRWRCFGVARVGLGAAADPVEERAGTWRGWPGRPREHGPPAAGSGRANERGEPQGRAGRGLASRGEPRRANQPGRTSRASRRGLASRGESPGRTSRGEPATRRVRRRPAKRVTGGAKPGPWRLAHAPHASRVMVAAARVECRDMQVNQGPGLPPAVTSRPPSGARRSRPAPPSEPEAAARPPRQPAGREPRRPRGGGCGEVGRLERAAEVPPRPLPRAAGGQRWRGAVARSVSQSAGGAAVRRRCRLQNVTQLNTPRPPRAYEHS